MPFGLSDSNLAYGHSKYANVAFTKELAKRLADEEILVFTLHPGSKFWLSADAIFPG